MAYFRTSIFGRFILYSGWLALSIAGLAVTCIVTVRVISMQTRALQQVWMEGATQLAGIDYDAEAFRVAELERAMATNPADRRQADRQAEAERDEVARLRRDYLVSRGREAAADLAPFDDAWGRYMAAHDAWVRGDNLEVRASGALDMDDRAVDAAIDRLADEHADRGRQEADLVDRLAQHMSLICEAVVAVLLMMLGYILRLARKDIIWPLAAITRTMTLLASGNREIKVPGHERDDEIGEMAAACEVFRVNVVALDKAHEAVRQAEAQAQLLARHDALTGLPNRRVFSADLQEALAHARVSGGACAVLLLDLDEFKRVNDLQGHLVGDVVLCEVARRLLEAVRRHGTVARLGGDEFAIITQEDGEPHEQLEHIKRLAGRLLGAIREPIETGEAKVEIGASIGIVLSHGGGGDVSGLLRAADIAMYRAKQGGRCTFRFFEQSMDDEMRDREALERDLVKALNEGQIVPYYQPLVDMPSQRIRGFEALARWWHPSRGFVPPDVFIPIVEQLGLTVMLSSAILRQVCRDARLWPRDICVAVNFSPIELKDPHLAERIVGILDEGGLQHNRLEVEITESALVSDLDAAKAILAALQEKGVIICLDDFGTGYSSLYHLRELKFDKVKIDRSFVQAMQSNAESEKIIDAILGLTKNLHLPAVVEGIETHEELRALLEKGCEYGQGFYFGKALPAGQTVALLVAGLEPMPVA